MRLEKFKSAMKYDLNFWIFDNAFILYKDLEVYEIETGESQYFDSWETVLTYEHNGKSIAEYIDELEDLKIFTKGGRGASGSGSSLFGGQAPGEWIRHPDLPARMNRMYNGNKMSQDHTVETFRKQHAASYYESAIVYDNNGFVSSYVHGGLFSVGFYPHEVSGKNMIHNHPSGSNFSKGDLDSFAATNMRGLSATGTKATYTITKTDKFDAKGFSKAIDTAKTTDKDYNRAVDRFLKRNSKRYGYTYSVTTH